MQSLKARWNEWYEIYGCLILKAVIIPAGLLLLALVAPVFWIPFLFWVSRSKVMD